MKKTLLMTSMWIAAGAVATGGTTAAMALAGGNSESAVLSQADVRARADAAGPAAPAATAKPKPGKDTTLVYPPAVVVVRCHRSAVTSFRVIPKTGWVVGDARITPLPTAKREIGLIAEFRHKTRGTYVVYIVCDGEKVASKRK